MADADSQGAVTPSNASTESAPVAAQDTNGVPPAAENAVAEQGLGQSNENRVPQSRFNEVIEQRNRERQMREQYESEIQRLRTAVSAPLTQQKPLIEAEAEAMAEELGMDKKAALRILQANEKVVQHREQALQAQLQQYQLGAWQEGLKAKYKDYNELSPKMAAAFDALPQNEQMRVLGSPVALEMFYHYVKGQNIDSTIKSATEQAAANAYQNKLAKQAATSMPGASSAKPAGALSREAILNMPHDEYTRRLPEVNAWLAEQAKR